MSVIIRLQNLPWSASAGDIRAFFAGLAIPEGGVHIVGGRDGDAFIAFNDDEDARQAMRQDARRIQDARIKLLLSSRVEMQRVIERAKGELLEAPAPVPPPKAASPPPGAVPGAVSGFSSFPQRLASLKPPPSESWAAPKTDPWGYGADWTAKDADTRLDNDRVIPARPAFNAKPDAKSRERLAAEILEREGLEDPEPYTPEPSRQYQPPPAPRDPRRESYRPHPAYSQPASAPSPYSQPAARSSGNGYHLEQRKPEPAWASSPFANPDQTNRGSSNAFGPPETVRAPAPFATTPFPGKETPRDIPARPTDPRRQHFLAAAGRSNVPENRSEQSGFANRDQQSVFDPRRVPPVSQPADLNHERRRDFEDERPPVSDPRRQPISEDRRQPMGQSAMSRPSVEDGRQPMSEDRRRPLADHQRPPPVIEQLPNTSRPPPGFSDPRQAEHRAGFGEARVQQEQRAGFGETRVQSTRMGFGDQRTAGFTDTSREPERGLDSGRDNRFGGGARVEERPKLGTNYAMEPPPPFPQAPQPPVQANFSQPPPAAAAFNPSLPPPQVAQLPPVVPPQVQQAPPVPPPAVPAVEKRSGRSLLPLPPPPTVTPTPLFSPSGQMPQAGFPGPATGDFINSSAKGGEWGETSPPLKQRRVLEPSTALGDMWSRAPVARAPDGSWDRPKNESWKNHKPPPDPHPREAKIRPPSLMELGPVEPPGSQRFRPPPPPRPPVPPSGPPPQRPPFFAHGFGPRFGPPPHGPHGEFREVMPPPEMLMAAERMRESSRAQSQKPDTRYAIVSRLPTDLSTKEALLDFFQPVKVGDPDNMKMLTGADGSPLGMAYVKFANIDDCSAALKKDGKFGIRIRPSDGDDFRSAVDGMPSRRAKAVRPPSSLLTVRHVPLEATEADVGAFFGLLRPLLIRRAADASDEGQAYHWFARFRSPHDAGSALLAKGEVCGGKVTVRESDEAEMTDYCGPEDALPSADVDKKVAPYEEMAPPKAATHSHSVPTLPSLTTDISSPSPHLTVSVADGHSPSHVLSLPNNVSDRDGIPPCPVSADPDASVTSGAASLPDTPSGSKKKKDGLGHHHKIELDGYMAGRYSNWKLGRLRMLLKRVPCLREVAIKTKSEEELRNRVMGHIESGSCVLCAPGQLSFLPKGFAYDRPRTKKKGPQFPPALLL